MERLLFPSLLICQKKQFSTVLTIFTESLELTITGTIGELTFSETRLHSNASDPQLGGNQGGFNSSCKTAAVLPLHGFESV